MRENIFDSFSYDTDSNRVGSKVSISGFFSVEIWRRGKKILQENFNGITTVGLNNMLGVVFHIDTQAAGWYVFPISATSFSALSVSDTMASHAGWLESVAYSESTRQQWTCGTPSGGSITNSSPVVHTVNADGTIIVGMGIANIATKNTTTGTLWCTGLFDSAQTFSTGDLIKTTYTVNLTIVA